MSESNEINNTIYDAVSNALENKNKQCTTLLPSTTGKSAYDLAVDYGYVGTESMWLKYIKADGGIQAIQDFLTKPSDTQVSIPDYGNIPSLQGYISTMFENGGLPATPFETKALMTASALVNGKYAQVTDDTVNNGLYIKTKGSWVKSDYDPLTQAKAYTDSNALFKPQRLELISLIDDIKSAGIYHVPTAAIASALNLPDASEGQIYVSGNTKEGGTGYVFQTYINKNGNTYQRVNTGSSWTAWAGNYIGNASFSKNLNDYKEKGSYHVFTGGMATAANNYPFTGTGGILTVMIAEGIIRQNYVSAKGTAQRYGTTENNFNTVSWENWNGVKYLDNKIIQLKENAVSLGENNYKVITYISQLNGNLNEAFNEGLYFINNSSIVTTDNGFPITGSGGYLKIIKNASESYSQEFSNSDGRIYRYSLLKDGVHTWQDWKGIKYKDKGITDITEFSTAGFIKQGEISYKLITDVVAIGGNLDTVYDEGLYFINNGFIASTANGFPITGSGGYLTVKKTLSTIHQMWQNYNGYAYRWGTIKSGAVPVWQAWRGATNTQDKIIDLNAISAVVGATEKTKVVVYGSSTMWHLTDEFAELATRKNLDLTTYGISGDTLAGAALGANTNKVSLNITGGELIQKTYVPVTFTSTFGDYMRKLIKLELSNGVEGTFNPLTSSFYAENITGTMTVSSTEFYQVKSKWLKPDNAIYIVNIGKNNVSSTEDNSQFIIDKTVELINDLPKNSKFIVGGHQSNYGSTDIHRTVVEKVNKALKDKYGLKYFSVNDILFSDATWTKLGLTKTPEDITAINNRRLPPSLSRDNAHLSPAMDVELALVIENKLTSLGYIT